MKSLLLSISCLFFIASSFSQNASDSTDLSYYFDDGGISSSKSSVKLNLATIYIGDVPLSYERIFNEKIGIEVGLGKLMGYYNPDLIEYTSAKDDQEEKDKLIKNPKGGYSYFIFPKLYTFHDGQIRSYQGLKFRKRTYTFEQKEDIIYTDVTFNYGISLPIYKKLIFEYNTGIGFRFRNDKNSIEGTDVSGLSVPIALKIGYLL